MNAVLYLSGTGASRKVAEDMAESLGWECLDIVELSRGGAPLEFGTAVVVFPVHSQGAPSFLKPIFKQLTAEYAAIIATYGRMGAGNAVYEAAQLLNAKVCVAAYIPARHSYIENDDFAASDIPGDIISAILHPHVITIPKRRKTPFAGLLPNLRGRFTVKIKRGKNCNSCGHMRGCLPGGSYKKRKD